MRGKHIRSNLLLSDINLSGGAVLSIGLTDSVNLVINRSTVMVTHLTSTGNSPLDVGRMPSTNTGDLSETLVSLSRQLLGTPTGSNTVVSVTLGDGDDINHLILLKDGVNANGLLKQILTERDLVGDAAAVDLNLHEMGLLLLKGSLADLGVGKNTHDSAVLLDTLELAGDAGALGLGVLLGVLGESLLLRLVPILVEATLDLVRQVLGPHGGEGAQATGSLDVTDKTNNDHLKNT